MNELHLQNLEAQIEFLLLDELGDDAKIRRLPKRDEVGYVADYVISKMSGDSENYPYILVAVDGAEIAADSTKRLGRDRAQVTVVVAYRTAQRGELYVQRRMAKRWCMFARVALQGRVVDGGEATSEGVVQGFDMQKVFNDEQLCMYRATLSLALSVDLDAIPQL